MGWKTIKGRRFFYEDIYVDGERTWKSWGSGIEAQQAALRVEKVKAENARDLALVRAWEERDWGIDKKTDVLDRLVQREVRTFLVQEGFHQQNYRWTKPWTKSRKKTMKDKEIGELNSECVVGRHEENVGLAEGIPLENEVRRLSLEALRGMGGKDPANVTLGCQVDKTIEEVTARVAEMRAEFGYEEAIPFEKLLIEQMSTAWVQWFVASWLLESEHCDKRSWRQNQYLERRYLRCQVRLTRVIDQLAKMRQVPRAYLLGGKT